MTEASESPRFVFDTNALVSAVLFTSSVPGRAFLEALERGVLLASGETMEELADVLARPKFDRYILAEERRRFLTAFLKRAELVDIQDPVEACRDPKDDKFLSLAVTGSASVIVTGDEDLLVLHPFRGVRILRPAEFLSEVTEG